MANNIQAFKTEFRNLFANTTNLDAATKQKIRNRYVLTNPVDWQNFLDQGNTDTAANRGTFAIEMIFRDMRNVFRAGSVMESQTTLPPAETLD